VVILDLVKENTMRFPDLNNSVWFIWAVRIYAAICIIVSFIMGVYLWNLCAKGAALGIFDYELAVFGFVCFALSGFVAWCWARGEADSV
jgi:hypothetical protein